MNANCMLILDLVLEWKDALEVSFQLIGSHTCIIQTSFILPVHFHEDLTILVETQCNRGCSILDLNLAIPRSRQSWIRDIGLEPVLRVVLLHASLNLC